MNPRRQTFECERGPLAGQGNTRQRPFAARLAEGFGDLLLARPFAAEGGLVALAVNFLHCSDGREIFRK
jgi:hypothetical protein